MAKEPPGKAATRFSSAAMTAALGLALAILLAYAGPGPADWAFVKLALALGLMVLMLREDVLVGVALLVGGLFMALAFRVGPWATGNALTFGAFDAGAKALHGFGLKGLSLATMVFLINVLGLALTVSGGVRTLVEALEQLARDVRWVMAGIPAIIGLLPMPGGAMLSAPMVDELGERLRIDPPLKTVANYWFRHVWEYWWPIYPGILLARDYVSMREVMLFQSPLSLVAIAVGWFFIVRRIRRPETQPGGRRLRREVARVLGVLWPVLTVVAVMLSVRLPEPYGDWTLPLTLLVVNGVLFVVLRLTREQIAGVIRGAASWQMAVLVFAVYVLRGMFHVSHAAEGLPAGLASIHVPPLVACFVIPCVVGAITGYTVAGVSTTFPLFVVVFQRLGPGAVAVAYAGSFLGVLISPVHLCLALTREYFQAAWDRVYRLLLPMLAVQAAAVALLGWLTCR